MRTLKRNLKFFSYRLFREETDILDSSGYKTGRKQIEYESPVTVKGNVAFGGANYRATSGSSFQPYGIKDEYSVTIIPEYPLPVDTKSLLTIGLDEFIVVKVVDTINGQTIYAKER